MRAVANIFPDPTSRFRRDPRPYCIPSQRGKAIALRQLVGRSLEPLVGPNFLHFGAVLRVVGAENRKIGLKIAFSGS